MNQSEKEIVKEIILRFIKMREFLGYQLSYECNMMTEDQFNKICDEYLTDNSNFVKSEKDIKKTKLLLELIPEEADSELISMLLNCSIDNAFKLIKEIKNG